MAPRKNTKSDSTPAPVASEVTTVNTGRKNTKSASNPAPVAASKVAKVPAGRKNTKSATTPAPVDDSKATTVYAGRKTRAMIAAEEKAAEEKAATETGNAAVKANVAANDTSNTVKPAVTKAKIIKTVKPVITEAKTVEPIQTAQPVKGTTLKSATSALRALRAATKTHQAATEDPTAEVATSTLKHPAAIMKPATVTPAVADPIIAKTTRKTMSVAQAAEFMRVFRCSNSAEMPIGQALVTPIVEQPVEDIEEITPVRTVHPPQADEDKDLLQWLKVHKNKGAPWGTQLEAVGPETMARDFQRMGFRGKKRQELLDMKEPILVDGLMQRVAARTDVGAVGTVPGTGPEPPKQAKRAPKYQELVIFEDKDWFLFDPLKGYPKEHGEPPYSITRWATFVPGNARVLLKNTKSVAVTSHATPASLLNCTVEYTTSGPRIVGWKPIPNLNKEVAPDQPASAPSAPPLLGRGARRNATRVVAPPPVVTAPAVKKPSASALKREAAASEAPPPVAAAPTVKKPSISALKREAAASEAPPSAPTAPAAKKPAPKRKAAEISATEPPAAPVKAEAPPPPPASKKRKTAESSALEQPAPPSAPVKAAEPPPAPAAEKRKPGRPKKASTTSTTAPKKRKAEEISAAAEPAVPASAPIAAAPAPKKRKTKAAVAAAALPAPVVAAAPVAPPPALVAPLAGVKRKRRATRPKKTPAVVENSSSE